METSKTKPDADMLIGVAAGLNLVLIGADELLVQFGTRSRPSVLLRDADLTGLIGRVIGPLLHEPTTMGNLLSGIQETEREEACALLADLVSRGVLSDHRASPVQQYIRYTFSGESNLAERSVSVIGCGPIGARLARSLLQHGVGEVILLDGRKTDRQWGACSSLGPPYIQTVDKPAHKVVGDYLLSLGHAGVDVLDAQLDAAGVEAAVARSDLTIVAFEQPSLRLSHLINRFCIRARKPWMLATIDGNFGLVGPLFLPKHTACYNCYVTLADSTSPTPEIARRYRQHMLDHETSSFFPGLPSYAEIVSGHASLAAVHFLLRDTSFALGRVLLIDFERMEIDIEDVLRLPRCPACSIDRKAYRPPLPADVVARP